MPTIHFEQNDFYKHFRNHIHVVSNNVFLDKLGMWSKLTYWIKRIFRIYNKSNLIINIDNVMNPKILMVARDFALFDYGMDATVINIRDSIIIYERSIDVPNYYTIRGKQAENYIDIFDNVNYQNCIHTTRDKYEQT